MKIAIALFAFFSVSRQAVLRSLLHSYDTSLRSRRDLPSQILISPSPQAPHSIHLPLSTNFTHDLVYFTTISIGTPAQEFQVLVDIASPDTFVSSVSCLDCARGGGRYDSSASTSFHPDGSALQLDYGWMFVSGNVSQDTLSFGARSIKDQKFVEARSVQPVGLSWDSMDDIHGIVGLTPSSAGSSLKIPSPFMTMASQNLLDENVFSLRLREPRELAFGGVNYELFTGNITRIPLTNHTSPYGLTGRWQADAGYMAIGSMPGIRHSLRGLTASFSTSSAYILLPDLLVYNLLRNLEFEDIAFIPPSVSCDKRAFLPHITFNLAGHNFSLTPYDWTFEWPMAGGHTRCVSAIMPIGLPDTDTSEIRLGSAFLRTFYSVFDLDTKAVGFATLSESALWETKANAQKECTLAGTGAGVG